MTLCVYGSTFVCLSLCVCLYLPYGCACLCICECGSRVSCLCMLTSTSFQHGVGYSTHTGLRLPAVGRHGTRRGLLMALDTGFVIHFNWTKLREVTRKCLKTHRPSSFSSSSVPGDISNNFASSSETAWLGCGEEGSPHWGCGCWLYTCIARISGCAGAETTYRRPGTCMHAMACQWRSEDNFQNWFSLHRGYQGLYSGHQTRMASIFTH